MVALTTVVLQYQTQTEDGGETENTLEEERVLFKFQDRSNADNLFDPSITLQTFIDKARDHANKIGFIPSTNRKFKNAPDVKEDVEVFLILFLCQGNNINKCLKKSHKPFVEYLQKRVNQYRIYRGDSPRLAPRETLTLDRIASCFAYSGCWLRKLGVGSQLLIGDLTLLPVRVPQAMQTTLFAGVCPQGPPKYCYYFYHQFVKKVFPQSKVCLSRVKQHVDEVFQGNTYVLVKEREYFCVKLGLASRKNGVWMWKKRVWKVFTAADKEWDCIEEAASRDGGREDGLSEVEDYGVYHCLDC